MDFFFAIHDVLLYTLNETVVVVYDLSPCQLYIRDHDVHKVNER